MNFNLGDFLSTGADNILNKMVAKVNTAASQVDLSGVKTPTIKTNNSFGGPIVWVAGAVVVAFLLFFKKGR